MKVIAMAGLNLRRLFRERTNIFFVILAPLLFLLVLGLLFGGGQPLRLGVVGADSGPLERRLVEALSVSDQVEVERFDRVDDLRTDVERGLVNGGVVIPAGYDARVRAGGETPVRYLTRETDPRAVELGVWVRSVVQQEAALTRAARVGVGSGAGSFEESLRAAESLELPGAEVELRTAGEAVFPEGLNPFASVAPSLLLLFVFLNSLTAALGLVAARRAGVTRRIYATPTRLGTIVVGEALSRFVIALTQGLVVLVGAATLFGVDWGDPLGAAALVVVFCLVGSGAAMLLGSLFRDEGPALGVSLGLGLGLGALGGTMVPLELLGEPVQRVARFTPHAWGYEGFVELVRHGGTVADILPQLGALTAFAVVLFALGGWRLRRVLTR